jgi:4-hydroxyphenylacetate 3-monooxygenase
LTPALPCSTPGLRFLCRESFDLERSHFDHPLASRFEDMDRVVFFDDVLVPWERVFLLGDVDLVNGAGLKTHASRHSAHQGAAKNLAKCELVLGVALLMTQMLSNAGLPHSEERLGELIMYTELMRACMRACEANAELDEWGVMCPAEMPAEITRNLFMTAYPRMVESRLQQLHDHPERSGFRNPARARYRAVPGHRHRDRVKLFRLACDIAGSSFGSRQVLYERFFASDPLTRARVLNALYPKKEGRRPCARFPPPLRPRTLSLRHFFFRIRLASCQSVQVRRSISRLRRNFINHLLSAVRALGIERLGVRDGSPSCPDEIITNAGCTSSRDLRIG